MSLNQNKSNLTAQSEQRKLSQGSIKIHSNRNWF